MYDFQRARWGQEEEGQEYYFSRGVQYTIQAVGIMIHGNDKAAHGPLLLLSNFVSFSCLFFPPNEPLVRLDRASAAPFLLSWKKKNVVWANIFTNFVNSCLNAVGCENSRWIDPVRHNFSHFSPNRYKVSSFQSIHLRSLKGPRTKNFI